jgi:ABC-type uncharacterized transport system permease subunit
MSSSSFLVAACIAIYCVCTYLFWRDTKSSVTENRYTYTIPVLTVLVIILHGYLLYRSIYSENGPIISLGLAISMAGWVSVFLHLCISLLRKNIKLGIIVMPIGLIAVVLGAVSTSQTLAFDQIPEGMGWHIALAVPTYGVLCVAFAQACLLIVQDRMLHRPNQGAGLLSLPAIQTMEANLYWLTLAGFTLMTVNLVMGMASNYRNSGVLLSLNHHILLSILAWIGFASLLIGRKIAGWRGEIAAKWTIIAFGVLFLAYFGTRFVNDILLGG